MRFSLRSLLLTFVVVGLMLAVLVGSIRLREAQSQNHRLMATYGVGDPQAFALSYVGDMSSPLQDRQGFHLFRLDSPADFVLRAIVYDGVTQQSQGESIKLSELDNEVGIWAPRRTTNAYKVRIRSLKNISRVVDISTNLMDDAFVYGYPAGGTGAIVAGPVLIYIYCPVMLAEVPNFQWIGLDEQKLKAWCDEYQAHAVYFELKRR